MNISRHGLSIGIERMDSTFFLTMKAIGKLTHEDYEIITPMIDSALTGVKDAEVHMLIDGTEMEGWDARAAWDDFKLGVKHGKEFKKIAIYGNTSVNKNWQEIAAKVGSWFVSGEVKYFNNCDDALKWIGE